MDQSHLIALETGLSRERARLSAAKNDAERRQRSVWVAQLEREVTDERRFLGIAPPTEMTDAQLLAELES